MTRGDRSRRGSAPLWRIGVALIATQAALALVLWWISGNPLTAGVAMLAVPVCAAILYVGAHRLRRDIARVRSGIAQWDAHEFSSRISVSASSDLARLVRELNEAMARVRARLLDLTARQAEADAILQSMTSGVVALDPEHRIIRTNLAAERLLQIDGARARGRLLEEVVRQPELHRLVAEAMKGGARRQAECTLPNGARVEVQVEPLLSAPAAVGNASAPLSNPPAGLLMHLNDVTQMRRLETLRTDFAANVSHELRTPITNIKGYLETLRRIGVDDREQAGRFLEIIHRNVERLSAIVDDVMALTRLEQAPPRSPSDVERESPGLARQHSILRPIVEAAIGQHRALADQKAIKITIDIEDSLAASVHPALLEQAVGNLLSNAVNYSPPRTTVTVAARRSGNGRIEIAVTDEGPGIAPEHHERIFERFYRVDRARSRNVGGTGLGLAIVKHIAKVHGGQVQLESAPGKGSTFRIVLPE